MHEIQSENFGKDADVSMEIRIVTYTGKFEGPNSGRTQKVISDAHLSDEKSQIAATTFVNTVQMLDDIHQRGELEAKDYNTIIQITDGCAGQYKCGTALYMLAMNAQQTGKLFYHFVKCAGHGKCQCDAEGGCHKTFCDTAFYKFVKVPKQE